MPTTPPLLILHGALGSGAQFDALSQLVAPTRKAICFNFAGHGGSLLPPEPLRIESMADQLAHFLEQTGEGPMPVFGYSMGGYVALWLEAARPGTFQRIVTLGTKLDWEPNLAEREATKLDAETLQAQVPKFAETLAHRHAPVDWRALLRATAEMMRHLGSNPTLTHSLLANIQCPVRLCVGDRDTTVSVEETLAAYRHLPKGQLAVLPGTPHPWEKVDLPRFAAGLLTFMAQ